MVDGDLVVSRSLRIPRSEIDMRFTTSSGPGGQHVNKVATRVVLRFDVRASRALSDQQRQRIMQRHGRVVQIAVDETRSQARNRALAEQRLADQLVAALRVRKPRKPTRRTRGSIERRLQAKARRSQTKANRRKPRPDS